MGKHGHHDGTDLLIDEQPNYGEMMWDEQSLYSWWERVCYLFRVCSSPLNRLPMPRE